MSEKTVEDISVHIRIPSDLRDQIKTHAKKNARTMNVEIIALLERGLLDEIAAIYELKAMGEKIINLTSRLEAADIGGDARNGIPTTLRDFE
jgi:hypothetical protein